MCEIARFSKGVSQISVQTYSNFSIPLNTSVVIFDEVHYLKNISAQRTQKAHNQVFSSKPKYLLGLSGTPIKNRVPEWWSLIKLCAYGNTSINMGRFAHNPHAFNEHFTHVTQFKVHGRILKKYTGLKNAEELRNLVRPTYLRRTAIGLPDRVAKFVSVSDKELNKKEFQQELEKEFQSNNSFSTAKKQNAINKTPHTINLIQDFLDQDTKVVVFTDHVDSCEAIATAFKVKPLHGSTPIKDRVQAVSDFEHNFSNVLVCTIGAMSTGFSILSANHMVFNDLPWVPSDLAQAEARIRRITQTKTCFYHYVFSGDIDKKIYKTLTAKLKTIKEVTNV